MGGEMSLPALKDLFEKVRSRATGLWKLGQDPQRTVFLEGGDVVFAASTHPLDRLTHLLVERGKITQAQLDYAMANLNTSMSIGKNLIEMGFITQRDLLDVARAQVERVVWAGLAETGERPLFEAKELEASIVRLPFDTPSMLLAGVLNLRDRERVLDELGPLNQVVVLEGRRHQELSLPADLVRLPTLLDGTRTLLELSREAGVEPFRLGAFVLFLREMGWARLHELPPLDRRALELALEPEEAPLSQTLPDPPAAMAPSLFAEIHASQHPTTNLEHLSEALDQLGAADEVEPLMPVPPPPAPPLPVEPEPALPIQHQAEGTTEPLNPPVLNAPTSSRRPLILLLLVTLAAVGSGLGYRWFQRRAKTRVAVATPGPKPSQLEERPQVGPAPTTEAPKPQPEAPKPIQEPEAKPAPVAPSPTPTKDTTVQVLPASRDDRFKAILTGDWKSAMAQGAAQRKALLGKWTLRLEIACQGSTVQHAAGLLKDLDPDLFILPMTMRDGRTCTQVFLGSFGSEAAAKAAAKRLPAPFLAEGNRPKPFRVAQIPDRQ
jgi:septal ring-binding cell division protein DamX